MGNHSPQTLVTCLSFCVTSHQFSKELNELANVPGFELARHKQNAHLLHVTVCHLIDMSIMLHDACLVSFFMLRSHALRI